MTQNISSTHVNELDELIERLCQYLDERRVQFAGKQLNEAGELFERYDFATARMVVEGKGDPTGVALVHVLTEVHRARLSPDKASYLIRHLNQICQHRRQNA